MIFKFFLSYFILFSFLLLGSGCSGGIKNNITSTKNLSESNLPNWYISPKQNNADFLYGVAEGFSLEEATRNSLAECAARLMVSVSSESQLTRQADNISANEEIRQKTLQSVEKINFLNYSVSRSSKVNDRFYVEVKVEKTPFFNDQKERVEILRKKIRDLDSVSKKTNPIQRRLDLMKIVDFGKELELKLRILAGSGLNLGLSEGLTMISEFQQELAGLSMKIDFVIDAKNSKDLSVLIIEGLNREGFKISSKAENSNSNQVLVKTLVSKSSSEIYGAKMVKLSVSFSNLSLGKIVASNSLEFTGSSAISEEEAQKSALKKLHDEIERVGILKILGITS